jgi:hypothetical protein
LPQNPLERSKPPGSLSGAIKRKPPAAGMGRKKGVPNKTTALLKDAILKAAEGAGGKAGLIGYLQAQAKKKNSGPFLALLGKVLPTQIAGDPDNPVATPHTVEVTFFEGKARQTA